jgi:hypothetical protein
MRSEMVRASVIGVLGLSLLITGCSPTEEQPAPTAVTTPTATATPEPDPEFIAGGTAEQNRPYFEFVLNGLLEQNAQPTSRMVVDSLAGAGFDKAAMQVTVDTTPVGQPADSILVSVLLDSQCLIGQIIGGELSTQLADVLGTGRCLVGRTLSIDW